MMRPLLLLLAALPAPAAAQLRPVADQPASRVEAEGGVDVLFVNEGAVPADPRPPERLEVTAADGARLTLVRDSATLAVVAPGGFAKLRYRPETQATAAAPPAETQVAGSTGTSSGFLDRFAPYRPTYGAFGFGDSAGKLQLSFAFRPFEDADALDGLRFAWTQTMFWRIDLDSGPFAATTYSPELFYEVPLAERTTAAIGYAHDSNGRGVAGSIDVNRIYARLSHRIDLGDAWTADISPEAWVYVGRQGIASDIERYWGYGAIRASLAQPDGVKLELFARGNPGTGKGSAELFASYPLARLGGGLGIYAFGQGFVGHGEALDSFRVRDSHARFGIALTR